MTWIAVTRPYWFSVGNTPDYSDSNFKGKAGPVFIDTGKNLNDEWRDKK